MTALVADIELAAILAVLVAILFALRTKGQRGAELRPAGPGARSVQLLRRVDRNWVQFATRPAEHPDVAEALATPGLAVRRDGEIEEGSQ